MLLHIFLASPFQTHTHIHTQTHTHTHKYVHYYTHTAKTNQWGGWKVACKRGLLGKLCCAKGIRGVRNLSVRQAGASFLQDATWRRIRTQTYKHNKKCEYKTQKCPFPVRFHMADNGFVWRKLGASLTLRWILHRVRAKF